MDFPQGRICSLRKLSETKGVSKTLPDLLDKTCCIWEDINLEIFSLVAMRIVVAFRCCTLLVK